MIWTKKEIQHSIKGKEFSFTDAVNLWNWGITKGQSGFLQIGEAEWLTVKVPQVTRGIINGKIQKLWRCNYFLRDANPSRKRHFHLHGARVYKRCILKSAAPLCICKTFRLWRWGKINFHVKVEWVCWLLLYPLDQRNMIRSFDSLV